MQKLTIRTQCKNNTTVVENEFIDNYMPKANGEYVKVYLYLLRHLNAQDTAITLSHMADYLDNTERDIMRALKYWETKGLLVITYDENENISGIDIATISVHNVGATPNTELPQTTPKVSTPKPIEAIAPKVTTIKPKKEFKQLLFMAEQYLGKTLSKSDMDMISYFYDTLHFPISLIEFLIEYCAENNHYSMHYIQSVALAWADEGILTVDDAKAQICNFNKDYYTVLKAYGISGRNPVANERQFIDKWINQYGFSMELIVEACGRTIASIHQPSYEYTDSILNSWKSKSIHYLSDLDKLDQAYQESKVSKAQKKATEKINTSKNTFNNFQQRSYDLDSLEMQLLNAK